MATTVARIAVTTAGTVLRTAARTAATDATDRRRGTRLP
jgi:hypothetical protein